MIDCKNWSKRCDGCDGGSCGIGKASGRPSLGYCLHACTVRVPVGSETTVPLTPAEGHQPTLPNPAIPRSKWPLLARAIARLAKPEDKGIGDTVTRLVDPVGGETFKVWYERITGSSCGCTDRQERLNLVYPYASA